MKNNICELCDVPCILKDRKISTSATVTCSGGIVIVQDASKNQDLHIAILETIDLSNRALCQPQKL